MLHKCVKLQGFRIGSHLARHDQALDQLLDWYPAGRLKFRETVAQGLEAALAVLINMLSGGNVGKPVVRLAAATERASSDGDVLGGEQDASGDVRSLR